MNGAVCSDSNTTAAVSVDAFLCDCMVGFSSGPAGSCEVDVDECASAPCENGAECTESGDPSSSVDPDAYQCSCRAGYANGVCTYPFLVEYTAMCVVLAGGNCDIDVNECSSFPCRSIASCTDSTTDGAVGVHSYSCNCTKGLTGINCDVDTDECASGPCTNGAACWDSNDGRVDDRYTEVVPYDAYACSCKAGFVGGVCQLSADFLAEYSSQCSPTVQPQ